MRKIARDLQVARETVEKVRQQPEIERRVEQARENVQTAVMAAFEQSLEEGRKTLQTKLPAIVEMVVTDVLAKRDLNHGCEIICRAGVYPDKDQQPRTNVLQQDNRLQIAIQQLLPGRKESKSAVTSVTPVTPVIDA